MRNLDLENRFEWNDCIIILKNVTKLYIFYEKNYFSEND